MLRVTLLTFFIFVLGFKSHSQKEAAIWHLGNWCGLNFLNIPATAINNGSITSQENCVSLSDSAGNLLFYSNSVVVWNAAHQVMQSGLPGNLSTVQGSLAFKRTGSRYYLFTLGELGLGPLAYSIIDMSSNSGLGSVLGTTVLANSLSEKMAATAHCNQADTWVLVHEMNNNVFKSYLVSSVGVFTNAVSSSAGPTYNYNSNWAAYGSFRFSPKGNRLAVSRFGPDSTCFIELYDFDNATGQVSGYANIANLKEECVSLEFSPDGNKLYTLALDTVQLTQNPKKIIQWDLCAGSASAIIASQNTVGIINDPGIARPLQLAIDGKIYFTNQRTVGRIDNPGLYSTACGFTTNVVQLNTAGNSSYALPNFPSHLLRQKAAFTTTANCGLVSFFPDSVFDCNGAAPKPARKWFFGDPGSGASNVSTLSVASHSYISNGTYTVKMVSQYNCYHDTTIQVLTINSLPQFSVLGKGTICAGEQVTYTLQGADNYTLNGIQVSSTYSLQPPSTTVYTLEASNNSSACLSKKMYTVTLLPCTAVDELALSDIGVYPNPGDGIFRLKLEKGANYMVKDILGKTIKCGRFEQGENILNLQNYCDGVYFLSFESQGGRAIVKLIKNSAE